MQETSDKCIEGVIRLARSRFWLVARRCEKTLQHLPASVCEHLPFLHGPEHPLTKLSPDRLYVTLHRHTDHILVNIFINGSKIYRYISLMPVFI